jgi:two-component system, sensor histidine kinase RegB
VSGSSTRGPLAELETTLVSLRWCAIAAQGLTLVFAQAGLRMALAHAPLWLGVGLLVIANLVLSWRARFAPTSVARVMAMLLLDMAVLAWLMYWTGGAANPFISLFLLPVALTATVLPASRVVGLAVVAALAYGVLMAHAHPLPAVPGTSALSLHLMGMWVNFMLSLVLLTVFALRLSSRLHQQRQALAVAREREQREQTLLGLAVQAAGTAHEINTPLATMATVVDDLRKFRPDGATLDADLALLAQQIEHCRRSVQALGASARGEPAERQAVDAWLRQLLSRWRIVRPQARVAYDTDASLHGLDFVPDLTLSQTVLNLFDNALDASLQRGREEIEISLRSRAGDLELRVRDFGAGINTTPAIGQSTKPDGLGLGLMLSTASLEAVGGRLHLWPVAGGGTEAVLHLPALSPEVRA